MKCFWSIDESASDLSLPDLCPCSMDVVEDRVQQGNPKKCSFWHGSFRAVDQLGDVHCAPKEILVEHGEK